MKFFLNTAPGTLRDTFLTHTLLPEPNFKMDKDISDRWNTLGVLYSHNCLAFALGALGLGSGQMEESARNLFAYRAEEIIHAGFLPIRLHDGDPNNDHIVAFFSGADDFHFMRLAADNTWVHKVGLSNPVGPYPAKHGSVDISKDMDSSLKWEFMGYYKVPETGIGIKIPSYLLNFIHDETDVPCIGRIQKRVNATHNKI